MRRATMRARPAAAPSRCPSKPGRWRKRSRDLTGPGASSTMDFDFSPTLRDLQRRLRADKPPRRAWLDKVGISSVRGYHVVDQGLEIRHCVGHGKPVAGADTHWGQVGDLFAFGKWKHQLAFARPHIHHPRIVHDRHDELVDGRVVVLARSKTREV